LIIPQNKNNTTAIEKYIAVPQLDGFFYSQNGGFVVRAEHLQARPIKVSGHLDDVRGISQMKLSWYDHNGERGRKSISTGLPVKGNKRRAEDMLKDAVREQEANLA
jgi:hypothetical protein